MVCQSVSLITIRYNHCDLMMYKYQTDPKYGGNDDYFTLLYNASAFTREDKTLEYSEAVKKSYRFYKILNK